MKVIESTQSLFLRKETKGNRKIIKRAKFGVNRLKIFLSWLFAHIKKEDT